MLSRIRVILSQSHDPVYNMALEAMLLEAVDPEMVVLYLWQNEKTIVIGRHQNPYKECNLSKVKEDQVKIIRRKSGGGAVYHDLGNLNFTFIAGDDLYDVERQCGVIVDAIKRLGLNCEISGRNDLTIDGAKFSGHAYMSYEGKQCHHGTLLVDADLEKLSAYLTVSGLKIKSKGIDSVRSRVVNLCDLDSSINIGRLNEVLIEVFKETYGSEVVIEYVSPKGIDYELNEKMALFDHWDWNFLESPNFQIEHSKKFKWGIFEIHFENEQGKVKRCMINSDSLCAEDFFVLERALTNIPYHVDPIKRVIRENLKDQAIISDLCKWFDQVI